MISNIMAVQLLACTVQFALVNIYRIKTTINSTETYEP
jgi:hypothetical protein